jgi:thioester reductase-like protein
VHIIGTSSRIRHVNVIEHLQKYGLLRDSVSSGTVWARVRCCHGDMTQPHFGLTTLEFHRLGHRVQAIYNLGVCVSLIQKYSNLRAVNTRAILDIIELAACGPHVSTIHHLSTFSVPHLQSLSQSVRMQDSYSLTETAPTDYRPSTSDDHGYIKARWAAEMLLANAADRGFPTRIYRASLPTASTRTRIPPAEHGVIERIVTLMLRTGYVPKPRPGQPDMAVDLVPVDVLVSWLYLLSTMPPETDRLRIRHLTNPRPVPFTQLVEIIPTLANGPGRGELLNLETWLERAGKVCGASERRTY